MSDAVQRLLVAPGRIAAANESTHLSRIPRCE
jgi:hypothetical protein